MSLQCRHTSWIKWAADQLQHFTASKKGRELQELWVNVSSKHPSLHRQPAVTLRRVCPTPPETRGQEPTAPHPTRVSEGQTLGQCFLALSSTDPAMISQHFWLKLKEGYYRGERGLALVTRHNLCLAMLWPWRKLLAASTYGLEIPEPQGWTMGKESVEVTPHTSLLLALPPWHLLLATAWDSSVVKLHLQSDDHGLTYDVF